MRMRMLKGLALPRKNGAKITFAAGSVYDLPDALAADLSGRFPPEAWPPDAELPKTAEEHSQALATMPTPKPTARRASKRTPKPKEG